MTLKDVSRDPLTARVDEILADLESAETAEREPFLMALDRAVTSLEGNGGRAPCAAHRWLNAWRDAEVEAQFDNMPV